jgi:hypothetical protein
LLSSLSQVSSSFGFITVLWFKNVRAALDPKLVCLQETKLATITPQTAAEVLGHRFNDFKYLPAVGTRGGIMLRWHTDFIDASCLELRRFSLSMTRRGAVGAKNERLPSTYFFV